MNTLQQYNKHTPLDDTRCEGHGQKEGIQPDFLLSALPSYHVRLVSQVSHQTPPCKDIEELLADAQCEV